MLQVEAWEGEKIAQTISNILMMYSLEKIEEGQEKSARSCHYIDLPLHMEWMGIIQKEWMEKGEVGWGGLVEKCVSRVWVKRNERGQNRVKQGKMEETDFAVFCLNYFKIYVI